MEMVYCYTIPGVYIRLNFMRINGQESLRPTQAAVQWVPGVIPRGKARLGCDNDHSQPSSVEDKNE
jgi:hypothetical protein